MRSGVCGAQKRARRAVIRRAGAIELYHARRRGMKRTAVATPVKLMPKLAVAAGSSDLRGMASHRLAAYYLKKSKAPQNDMAAMERLTN